MIKTLVNFAEPSIPFSTGQPFIDDERSDKTEWRSASCRREGETREGPADCGQASGRDTQRPRCSVERLGDLMPVHTGLACHGWWVGLDGGDINDGHPGSLMGLPLSMNGQG